MPNLFQFNETQLITFFFVFIRCTSMFMFLPILGDRTIPPTVKILFGLAFSVMVFPILWAKGMFFDPAILASTSKAFGQMLCEVGFGMMLGFVARWIFDAVQFGGYISGINMGFSIGTVFDPHSESHSIAYAELHYIMAAMLFLALDGHHVYLSAVLQSFKIVPLGKVDLLLNGKDIIQYMIQMSQQVFILGLKLAAPVFVVILLVNMTFALISRAVPQMNVLSVSFSTNIIIGLFIAVVSLPGFANMVDSTFDSYMPELLRFMRLFHG